MKTARNRSISPPAKRAPFLKMVTKSYSELHAAGQVTPRSDLASVAEQSCPAFEKVYFDRASRSLSFLELQLAGGLVLFEKFTQRLASLQKPDPLFVI